MATAREGIIQAVLSVEAQHRREHPAHGFLMLVQLAGQVDALRRAYPDDPALAAALICERMPPIQGLVTLIAAWGRSVNDCDPSDLPETGARCHVN